MANSTKGDKKNLAVVRGEGIQKRKNTLLQEFKKVCVCVCARWRSPRACHASVLMRIDAYALPSYAPEARAVELLPIAEDVSEGRSGLSCMCRTCNFNPDIDLEPCLRPEAGGVLGCSRARATRSWIGGSASARA